MSIIAGKQSKHVIKVKFVRFRDLRISRYCGTVNRQFSMKDSINSMSFGKCILKNTLKNIHLRFFQKFSQKLNFMQKQRKSEINLLA